MLKVEPGDSGPRDFPRDSGDADAPSLNVGSITILPALTWFSRDCGAGSTMPRSRMPGRM